MEFLKETGRIYLEVDGKLLAEVQFPAENGVADVKHTFVDESLRGQGVATLLLEEAAKQISANGLKTKTTCSYAAKWFEKHTEYADLLYKEH